MAQSFPPISFLRSVRKLRLDVEVPSFTDTLDLASLRSKVETILVNDGCFTMVKPEQNCDVLMKLQVWIMATVMDGMQRPLGFAYIVRLSGLAPVNGQPHSELYIVAQEMHFGSCDAMYIGSRIMQLAGEAAKALADRVVIKEEKKPESPPEEKKPAA